VLWFSSTKSIQDSVINLTRVLSVTPGQNSENFKQYPLPSLSHLSFSVFVQKKGSKQVEAFDLTAKDELEYDLWLTGIKALAAHWRRMTINKVSLLSHSRVFNEMLREKKIGESSKALLHGTPEKYNSKRLVDCLTRKPMTANELAEKVGNLNKRIRSL
jgi:hypothetical protein